MDNISDSSTRTLRARFAAAVLGALFTVVVATVLAVLALRWLGYDFSLLSTSHIGDWYDTVFNSWTLFQSTENLLHRPFNLGYSTVFYGDPNAFSYTIAPYGIAISMLPVYLWSGGNYILNYNLYVISTFPLTALTVYWLVRYLFRTPVLASLVIGLMVAFAQYRFQHIGQVEQLSTHFLIFGVYAFHRLLDTPSIRWAAAVSIGVWLTALASGYLGMFLLLIYAVIILFVVLRCPQAVTRSRVVYLLMSGVFVVILLIPFIAFRRNVPDFVQGVPYNVFPNFSASVADWFKGVSQLYFTQDFTEKSVFLGITPLILAAIAWTQRKTQAIGNDGDLAVTTKRVFTSAELVALYALIVAVGYLLTLGPELKLSDTITIPLPHIILIQLPGFWHMRVPARFIVLAVIGTAVLGAFTLTLLYETRSRLVYYLVLAAITAVLTVELIPFNGSPDHRLKVAAAQETPFLNSPVLGSLPPAYAWLAQQPPDTPIFQYPADPTSGAEYFLYQPFYRQPMVNGAGSFLPAWWLTTDWSLFPDLATMSMMWERQIRYAVVNNRLMQPDARAMFNARLDYLERMWGTLPHVGTFGDDDIYELRPAAALRVDMAQPFLGSNWQTPVLGPSGSPYRLMLGKTSTIDLPLAANEEMVIWFQAAAPTSETHLTDLRLTIEDQPIALTGTAASGVQEMSFEGVIPQSALNPTGNTELQFHLDEPDVVSETNSPYAHLGIMLCELQILPRSLFDQVITFDFDRAAAESNWHEPEIVTSAEGVETTFQWMSASSSTIDFPPLSPQYRWMIEVSVVPLSPHQDILDSLTVQVNGLPIPLVRRIDWAGSTIVQGIIPTETIRAGQPTQIQLGIARAFVPFQDGTSADQRTLGLPIDRITLIPLPN